MLINKIELQNFRQFKDTQVIEFSTDSEKNVTVVMGENGAGKTTLEQAFIWCLYGDIGFKIPELINREIKGQLDDLKKVVVMVTLYLTHDQKEYRVSRWQEYKYNNKKGPDDGFLVSERNEKGDWEGFNEIKSVSFVQNMLPQSLAQFFFFDGEHIDKMSKDLLEKNKSLDFQNAVRGLAGLDVLFHLIEHFGSESKRRSVIGKFASQIDIQGDTKLRDITEQISRNIGAKEAAEKEIVKLSEEIQKFSNDRDEINQELGKLSQKINLQDKFDELENIKKAEEKHKKSLEENLFKFFSKNLGYHYLSLYRDRVLDVLKDAKVLDKGVPGVNEKTIDFLIKRGICICGEKITDNQNRMAHLHELALASPPHSIGTEVEFFRNSLNLIGLNMEDFYKEFREKIEAIRHSEGTINRAEAEQKSIVNSLPDKALVQELKNRLSLAILNEKKCINELSRQKATSSKLGPVIKSLKEQRENLSENSFANKKYQRYLDYAEEILAIIQEKYERKTQEVRKKLEASINRIFEDIYDGGIHIEVSERYNINTFLTDTEFLKDGTGIGQNTAQSYAIIFAFIAGIIELSRTSEDKEMDYEVYPLVMDAPLSSFDKRRIKQICEELPKIAEQVIIFIKDTDGVVAETYLSDRIGKQWKLRPQRKTSTVIERR